MHGQIIRIISNLYTVKCGNQTYDCRARGRFKNDGIVPLVGDFVIIDAKEKYILEIASRRNSLTRPAIANIDMCIVVASLKHPDYSPLLIDKMLTNVMLHDIKPVLCLTKYDLLSPKEQHEVLHIMAYYNQIGIPTILNTEIKKLMDLMQNQVVVLCGQTGAGKSTLMNKLDSRLNLATDEISEALGRGKHTTRHVELFAVASALIADTPGFSAFDLDENDIQNIKFTFPEFANDLCKYTDCLHIKEEGCAVRSQVERGEILPSRYESYRKMVEKCK